MKRRWMVFGPALSTSGGSVASRQEGSRSRLARRGGAVVGLWLLAACSGKVEGSADEAERAVDREPPEQDAGAPGDSARAPRSSDDDQEHSAESPGGPSSDDDPNPPAAPTSQDGGAPDEPSEPTLEGGSTKAIHRLNNREYNNTVSDLLGVKLSPADGFLNETADGFDNIATALGMTRSQYAAYFRAAEEVATAAFEEAPLGAQLASCEDASDEECTERHIETLGRRALRRPLHRDEVVTFQEVYSRARELGLEHDPAMQQVLRAMLASAEFLYRMEFDADPDSPEPHPVSDYELASRLSYFLWSSMPDDELFDLAERGELSSNDSLRQQVERMLTQERGESLVTSFTWQWLGMKSLESHAVSNEVYPEWSEELRASLLEEARLYLSEFVEGARDWSEFLTADLQFVDARLSGHYGLPSAGEAFERRSEGDSQRIGFIGTGAFLTATSFAHRTSPTLRAKWILEALLCTPPPPPPPNLEITDLDADELANQAASIDNVRERLELHRSDPVCAGCHAALDPLGLSLEHYDAMGRYRDRYENGDAVDSRAELLSGRELNSLSDLAEYLQEEDSFWLCTTDKLFTYALGRTLGEADRPHVEALSDQFRNAPTFPELVENVVMSRLFLERRGGNN